MLKDSIVALVTPFTKSLEVDYKAFENLIMFHLNNNTQGIVISGTTGESATLTKDEKLKLLEIAIKLVNKKIPIIFNSGNNNTLDSISLTKSAENIGADYILAVAPYYNKPTQNGLFEHFKAIASSTKLPVCLYNVPARTITNIEVDTVIKLSNIDNIIAIKDAVTDLNRPLLIGKALKGNFTQLCGEDSLTLAYLASGGKGTISVSSNVMPAACQEVHQLFKDNKLKECLELHTKLLNLHGAMFCETNPAPAKFALSLMGMCNENVRLPLVTLTESSKQLIKSVLKEYNLI
ncbi:4-hydroxy-tetrahydrodipicolinate synthase [Rickettsiales bacterium LUAb2]